MIRQLLVESLILSMLGGLAGLLLATLMIKPLTILISTSISRVEDVAIDSRVLLFTLAISVLTGLAFGVGPAILSSGVDINKALKEGSGGAGTGFRHNLTGNIMVVFEMALSLVLLIGAGLMIKSYLVLRPTSPGFEADNKLTFQIILPKTKYPTDSQAAEFLTELLPRLDYLPGATAVSAVSTLPYSGMVSYVDFSMGDAPPDGNSHLKTFFVAATPNYFRAMGTPLISGRDFADTDNQLSPHVYIINETMARRFWPHDNPLGKQNIIG